MGYITDFKFNFTPPTKLCVLAALCIYEFGKILRLNSDCFPKEH